jgi:hypothetical protein
MNRIAATDRTMQAQLDRLAAGDLPESERAALLAWLDEDAVRWRACGRAFLEAQMWEGALAGGTICEIPASIVEPRQAASPPVDQQDRARFSAIALAAATLVAFISGIVLAQWLPRTNPRQAPLMVEQQPQPDPAPARHEPPAQPLVATVSVRTNTLPGLPLMLQLPVAPQPTDAPSAAGTSISDYDRQKWNKRGFEVHEERRLLPATLPDGRPVVVPVNKVRLEYKGTPVS